MDATLKLDPLCPPPGSVAVITRTGDQRPLLYHEYSVWMNAHTVRMPAVRARSLASALTRPGGDKAHTRPGAAGGLAVVDDAVGVRERVANG
jgi:hypothetical protein